MYQLPAHLWEPQRRGVQMTIEALTRGQRVCLQSVTGSGKTQMAATLIQWALSGGIGSCFYVNRKLLVGQTAKRFDSLGIHYGIRAADYEEQYDPSAPVQICSADTERARVFKSGVWRLHDAGLVIVDEIHISKSETVERILKEYHRRGAMIVLLSATPIGVSHLADELVVAGRMAEFRACKAIVPAVVKSIEQPDMRKVKRNKTGEFILGDEKKAIYTQTIVGSVLDRWKLYNPDARPTLLYAPGKAESVWFTEKFRELGVNWCHIDAEDAMLDGKRVPRTRAVWDEIFGRFKDGDIKGISSRFVLREGVDAPFAYHAILATPIGSLASFLQTSGRVLRYSPETPDNVLITDHGGSYLRHGSPNHDRDWHAWWTLPEHAISEMHSASIKDGKIKEPIRCPRCEGERSGGIVCPHCKFEHPKSKRMVVMEDGRMVEHDGDLIPPRKVLKRSNTEELWTKMFWGYRKKGLAKSFNELAAFFCHEYGYSPPRNLPLMPKRTEDWYRHVHKVPMNELHGREGVAA